MLFTGTVIKTPCPGMSSHSSRAAWRTIAEEWNAQRAAEACLEFYEGWKAGCPAVFASGPLSRAPVLSARWKYDEGKLEG